MLFFALTLLTLTSASPLNLTSSEAFTPNVALPEPPLNKNLTAGLRCGQKPQPHFLVEDCYAAVQALYIDHVITHADKTYEFRSGSTPPKTKNPWMQTPVFYTVSKRSPSIQVFGHWTNGSNHERGRSWLMTDADTCSLTIVTLNIFGPKVLPGGDYEPYADYDTATFKSLWQDARFLEEDCLLSLRMPGWTPTGE